MRVLGSLASIVNLPTFAVRNFWKRTLRITHTILPGDTRHNDPEAERGVASPVYAPKELYDCGKGRVLRSQNETSLARWTVPRPPCLESLFVTETLDYIVSGCTKYGSVK